MVCLAEEALEDALHDSQALRGFARIDLGAGGVPEATTPLNLRRLLESNDLCKGLFKAINAELSAQGLLLREGALVGAALIAAPPWTRSKNRDRQRDPERHQTKKGNQWHFGMKAHIGADRDSKLVHTVVVTAAPVADIRKTAELLHGPEQQSVVLPSDSSLRSPSGRQSLPQPLPKGDIFIKSNTGLSQRVGTVAVAVLTPPGAGTNIATLNPMTNENRRRAFALCVLFGINTMNFYDRMILAAVAEPIRKEWALSDSALGLLGTAFTILYAFVGVPFGRWADTRPRKWLLGAGCALWSLLTAVSGMAQNFWTLFAARLGVGVGEASCAPAANSLIGDLYPPKQRSRALSIFMLGLPVGMFLSFLISGRIAHAYGWRTAFYVAAVPGLMLAALALCIAEPKHGSSEGRVDAAHRPGSPYLVVLGIPTLLWIIVSGALHNFNMLAASSFMTPLLARYHALELRDAAFAASLIFGVSGAVGLLAGGWAADRFGGARSNGRLLLSAGTMAVAAPCIYLALRLPGGAVAQFVLLMGAGLACVYVYYSSVYAAIQDVVEPRLRGTAMAIYFFAMYVLGGSLGPWGTGMLSDYFARRAMSAAGATAMTEQFKAIGLHGAMHVIPILCLVLAVVLYAASRTVGRDMTRLKEWQESQAMKTGGGSV